MGLGDERNAGGLHQRAVKGAVIGQCPREIIERRTARIGPVSLQTFRQAGFERRIHMASLEDRFERAFFDQDAGGIKRFHIRFDKVAHGHAAPGGRHHQSIGFQPQAGFLDGGRADAEVSGKFVR